MGMWTNHRARQAGKYQKQAAMHMQQLVRQQQAIPPAPMQVNGQAIATEAYQRGWRDGWAAAQRDLVDAVRSGRLSWEEVLRRIPQG